MILMIFAAFLKYIESASLSYRGSDQTLSNLQGTYEFKLWGAQGGAGYNDNSAGSGGKGAYVYGKTHFATKTTLTVNVGGQGASSAKGPNAGGWPNGGKGGEDIGTIFETKYEAGGGGGGSTSLLLGSTQLLVAGAGAGGVMYATGCQGGEFNYHYCSHSGDSSYCDRYAYNNRGNSNGYGGDGVDSQYASGSGGGGGYYGGQATGDYAVDAPEKAMACSGSSYYNPSYFASVNVSSTANSRSGNGYFEYNLIAGCTANCQNCPTSSSCSSCNSGYKLYSNACYSSCPTGTYQSDSSHCTKCPYECSSCSNANACTSCNSGYYLYDNQCYSSCPSGTYQSGGKCETCLYLCSECSSADTCSLCIYGSYFYDNQCYYSCPSGTYQSDRNNICLECPSKCVQCINSTHCQVCAEPYTLSHNKCISHTFFPKYAKRRKFKAFQFRFM